FFEQLAVIIKKTADALAENQLLDDSYGEVRLAHADRANQEQAGVVDSILRHELASSHARRKQRLVRAFIVEVCKLTVLVAFWNSRGLQQNLGPGLHAAITAGDAAIRTIRNRFPAGTFTERANFRSNFHDVN